jgi:hypothetical protein
MLLQFLPVLGYFLVPCIVTITVYCACVAAKRAPQQVANHGWQGGEENVRDGLGARQFQLRYQPGVIRRSPQPFKQRRG